MEHPQPRIRDRIVISLMLPWIETIVQLHGLVPVCFAAEGCEAVVAGSFGGELHVWSIAFGTKVEIGGELLVGYVVVIIVRSEEHADVVVRSEVVDAVGSHVRMIDTGGMVWHEVQQHLQSCVVSAVHQRLEFIHTPVHILRQSRRHVVIILYCVGRPGLSFHHIGVVGRYAGESGLGGHLYHAGVPYMGHTEAADGLQCLFGKFIELAAAVLLVAAVGHAFRLHVGHDARKHLVNYWLLFHRSVSMLGCSLLFIFDGFCSVVKLFRHPILLTRFCLSRSVSCRWPRILC